MTYLILQHMIVNLVFLQKKSLIIFVYIYIYIKCNFNAIILSYLSNKNAIEKI